MDLKAMKTAELVALYNERAASAGCNPVKKFADRATAEKRVAEIMAATKAKTNGHAETIPTDEEFGCRDGSNRAKALAALRAGKGKPVARAAVLTAVYGAAHKELRGPLNMVLKGLEVAIESYRLPYVLTRSRENKEIYFALEAK